MLYECNYPKFLMVKYGPLAFGLLILFGFIPKIISDNPDAWPNILFDMMPLAVISLGMFGVFIALKDKIKFVAIGKTRLIVKEGGKDVEYNWFDVERISL